MSSNNRIFCPRCATENASDQSYCRQCGLGLSGIQWVLDGNEFAGLTDIVTSAFVESRFVTEQTTLHLNKSNNARTER